MAKRIPVIIDCDPGLDDVIALIMAFASDKLNVKAVTVVAGTKGCSSINLKDRSTKLASHLRRGRKF